MHQRRKVTPHRLGSPRHIVSVRQVRLALQNGEDPQEMTDMGKLEDILEYMPENDARYIYIARSDI